jgi:hypothetical protein
VDTSTGVGHCPICGYTRRIGSAIH